MTKSNMKKRRIRQSINQHKPLKKHTLLTFSKIINIEKNKLEKEYK